jgi:pimeloyl-ACP methyl ester carboxylesterase
MGSPEELRFVIEALETQAQVLLPDFHVDTDLLADSYQDNAIRSFNYDDGADAIAEQLQSSSGPRKAFFVGVSSGGKIVYDFMVRHPDLYGGSLLLDIGPAPFQDASFFQIFKNVIPKLQLDQPWAALKSQIRSLLPDRVAQVLLSSQIFYPDPLGPAQWRPGVFLIDQKLQSQRISDQLMHLPEIADCARRAPTRILVASQMSSLSPGMLDQLSNYPELRITRVPESSHFLHVTQRDEVIRYLQQDFQEAVTKASLAPHSNSTAGSHDLNSLEGTR